MEDDYYANTFYAKVGGVTLDELNQLEYDFLALCNFDMAIKTSKYYKYHNYLSQFELDSDWTIFVKFINIIKL